MTSALRTLSTAARGQCLTRTGQIYRRTVCTLPSVAQENRECDQPRTRALLVCQKEDAFTERLRDVLDDHGALVDVVTTECPSQVAQMTDELDPDVIICRGFSNSLPISSRRGRSKRCLILHPGFHAKSDVSLLPAWKATTDDVTEWAVELLRADDDKPCDIWRDEGDASLDEYSEGTEAVINLTIDAVKRFTNDGHVPSALDFVVGRAHRNITVGSKDLLPYYRLRLFNIDYNDLD